MGVAEFDRHGSVGDLSEFFGSREAAAVANPYLSTIGLTMDAQMHGKTESLKDL